MESHTGIKRLEFTIASKHCKQNCMQEFKILHVDTALDLCAAAGSSGDRLFAQSLLKIDSMPSLP